MTFRTIQIEKGVPGYASINPNTNTAYISYTLSNFVIVVNLEKGSIESKVQLTCPGNIAINIVTNKVYVSSAYGVCEIDGENNNYHIINIGLPHSGGSVDVNPLTNLLHTTCFGHDILTVIDAATGAIADKIPVGKNPKGVAVDTSTNKVYVANYDAQSISVIDCNQSNRLVDSIRLNRKLDNTNTSPRFMLVNELSKLIYVQASVGTSGGTSYETLLVIDKDTKKTIQRESAPSHAQEGFAFNRSSNTLYMKKNREMTILRFDAYAKKVIHTTTLQNRSFWQRLYESFRHFAEVIATNPSTSKVYVSDSKNNLLYEIEG